MFTCGPPVLSSVCVCTRDGVGQSEVRLQQPHAFAVEELKGRQDFSQHASAELKRLQQLFKGLAS